jgi:hypothetical protein
MIALDLQDIHFMLKHLSLSETLRKRLIELTSDGDVLISDDLADELRDLCADRLDTHGFDLNYSPTEEGRKLEALIDKLYTG